MRPALAIVSEVLSKFGLAVCIAAAVMFGLEMLARAGIVFPEPEGEHFVHPVISSQSWGQAYADDLRPYRWARLFKPYVDFREEHYASSSINIDENGLRQTIGNCARADAFKIFMFGGSGVVSVGVPDIFTLPSQLAKRMAELGRCVSVTNFGANWWQSSQELAQFVILMREGRVPDLAIFYDGVNDIDVVTYGGTIGGIDPAAADQFNASAHAAHRTIRQAFIENSSLIAGYNRWLHPAQGKAPGNPFVIKEDQMNSLSSGIVQMVEQNVRMITVLSSTYNVPVLFILQPFPLISRKPLSEAEQQMRALRLSVRGRTPWESEFVSMVYQKWRSSSFLIGHPSFRDYSMLLDDKSGELFVDVEHLLPSGNAIVADAIARELLSDGRLRIGSAVSAVR